jgi:hypothetical protein
MTIRTAIARCRWVAGIVAITNGKSCACTVTGPPLRPRQRGRSEIRLINFHRIRSTNGQAGRRVQHGYARTAAEMVRERPKRQQKVDCGGRAAQTRPTCTSHRVHPIGPNVAGTFWPVPMLRRNNSLIRGANVPVLGVRAWGEHHHD